MGFYPPGGGTPLAIKDEGVTVTAGATSLDFTGSGVVASAIGTAATADVSGGGSGTVTSVSVTTANGVSGSVATATTTPAISLTLGAITPTSVAASGTVTGSNLSGTNTGDQTITLTGDVTGSGTGSFAATIANSAVTLAKMANMATASFLGRNTAGAGAPEVLSATTSTAILNAMVGDSGAGGTKGLVPAPGAGDAAAGKFLKADGTFAVPAGTATGTVTTVSVASANGFAGTVANATTTPAITLTTSITGILSGNGTAISAASTTGSGAVVLAGSPTLTAPALGTPTALVGTNITGTASGLTAGSVTNATFTTALTVNTGTVTLTGNVANTSALTLGAGASSISGANTGDQTITLTGGVTGSGTGSFAATVVTNANLTGPITSVGNATSIASQTGTGTKFVVDTSPVLVTPNIGVATATSVNKVAITAPATSATLTIADGKTLTANNSIALTGTDSTTMTFPTTSATIARTDAGQTFTGVNTFTSPKVITDVSDTNGNEVFKITATSSAVNEFTLTNAATGNDPSTTASGGDSNIGHKFVPKGTGTFYGNQETLMVAISDETTVITTGTAKVTFYMPYDFSLVKVKASVTTVSSSGLPTFNLKDDGVSVFSTKVTIDANENFSDTAATPSVLTSTPLAVGSGSAMTIDIDVAGTGATGAKLYIIGYATAKP